MNFLRKCFRKLSSDRQTDTTEIIYHVFLWVVNKCHVMLPYFHLRNSGLTADCIILESELLRDRQDASVVK